MEKEFVPYVLSKQIKQLGFNEECFGYYVDVEVANPFLVINRISDTQGGYFTLAPLWQQAFRWLYQKLDIEKGVMPLDIESQQLLLKELIDKVSSKEEAELELLKKLIEIVKNK